MLTYDSKTHVFGWLRTLLSTRYGTAVRRRKQCRSLLALTDGLSGTTQKIRQLREKHITPACARVGKADMVRETVEQTVADNLAAAGRESELNDIQGNKEM